MTLLGQQIRLIGTSQKGKNRIRDNPGVWVVLAEANHVLFAPSEVGPWLFVAPKGCDQNHRAARWIRATGDSDFLIQAED